MKHYLLPGLLLVTALHAAPVLHVEDNLLTPEATIRVTFDRPMVPADQVGIAGPNKILSVQPALAGRISWTQPNIAQFILEEAPKMGTKHSFSLHPNLTHLDGSEVPAGSIGSVDAEAFHYQYALRRGTTRQPQFILRFSDAVRPGKIAQHLQFRDHAGQTVATKVTRSTWEEIGSTHMLGPTWDERLTGWERPDKETLSPRAKWRNLVTVTPISPLPVGRDWRLNIKSGLPNATNKAHTIKNESRWSGSVREFVVAGASAATVVNVPRHITVTLSKPLPNDFDPATLTQFVTVEPVPAKLNYSIANRGSTIVAGGDFSSGPNWRVSVKPGLVASDGATLEKAFSKELTFTHLPPGIGLPSHEEAQLASGSRDYPVDVVNLESVRIRVKELKGANAIRALQGYRHYTGKGAEGTRTKERRSLPMELIAGKTLHDKVYDLGIPLDTSHRIDLDWNALLKGRQHGILFVSVEGEPRRELDSKVRKTRIAQSFVQLTDLGLAWKLNDDEAFLYAYSCDTGQPIADVTFEIFGEDAAALETARSGPDGIARLPRHAAQRHLRARLGKDNYLTAFDQRLPVVSMWHFPVRYEWTAAPPEHRTAFLFTDRSLYRPGEKVHLKGLVRHLRAGKVITKSDPPATLVVRDNKNRVILETTIDEPASFDHSFTLPERTVGRYWIQLTWPDELAAAEALENWREKHAAKRFASFNTRINVQEFRRNSFEVTAGVTLEDADTVTLDTRASYFQGQALDGAEAQWFVNVKKRGFYPDAYRDFYFCDHRSYDPYYWSHYFGYREDGYYGSSSDSDNGEVFLGTDGSWKQRYPLPETDFPAPRVVTLTTEVTDARDQTLSGRASLLVHSSDLYLGIGRMDRLIRTGSETGLKLVAAAADGSPATESIDATLVIEREINEQVKTRNPDGTVVVRNEKRTEKLSEQALTITPEHNGANGLVVPFVPQHAGRHVLTLSGKDSAGRPIRTAVIQYVYGSKEYPWAYENDMKIKLVPEKKGYKPGDTARILVLTPIEGTALVTVEREKVSRHFLRDLKADNPVIEIPLSEVDAPNAFVSVLIIKGAGENLRKHKEPIVRLGYCELLVDPVKERLDIALDIPGDYHRPGEQVTIHGTVSGPAGQPVAGAEVTLFAEDEGTLAVMGYRNPDPLGHFYAPRSILTRSGTSLGNFISEDPEARRILANKGFFVGGGDGFDDSPQVELRTDFNPCALWSPSLVTDARGRFTARFDAPDTLTRYRVIAVVAKDFRFGSKTGEFVVNKPLMLEPAAPRFAHEGDRLQPKVLVQNTTEHEGAWRVTLQLDSLTAFTEGEEREQSKTITLGPKSSITVPFDVHFRDTGTTRWTWQATPVSLADGKLTAALRRELSDAVVSSLDVEYPMPLLREAQLVRFQDPAQRLNLLDKLSPNLLGGRGELELEFGRSLLLEAGGAFEFLLHYPYGCVEQTSSSTLPWIAAKDLRASIPAFASQSDASIAKAIQAGADRLLTMQTKDGGLAYWPGGDEASSWASCYGGMTLILCRDAGANVPEESVAKLTSYLSKSLREMGKDSDWWAQETAARTCYTLALAGKAEASYHNLLVDRIETLPVNAIPFLALAIHHAGGEDAEATALKVLAATPRHRDRKGHWMPYHPDRAYRLHALATISPESSECETLLDQILKERAPNGNWRTTWCNAWTTFGLASYARATEKPGEAATIHLATDEGSREIVLDRDQPSTMVRIPLHGGLSVSATGPAGAIVRVKLAAKPALAPLQPVATNGLKILRTYHRVHADGSETPLDRPQVGDLLHVRLGVTLPVDETRYLVVEDPLPAICEAVNTDFVTQAGRLANKRTNNWAVSYQELRDDRAVFFVNRTSRRGTYEVAYYARVTTAGDAIVPPAKVEAMYDPRFVALSASNQLKTPNPIVTSMK